MPKSKAIPSGSFFQSVTCWRIVRPDPTIKLRTVKVKLILKAYVILESIDWAFDNVLYPAVLAWLGSIVGGIVMTLLSALACYILLLYYMQSKEDWLGVDVLEAAKARSDELTEKLRMKRHGWRRILKIVTFVPATISLFILWVLKKNDVAIFFALSIFKDAFRTVAFLRHGRKGTLTGRDWFIFWASIAVSNVWWTFRWSIIIVAFKKVFF